MNILKNYVMDMLQKMDDVKQYSKMIILTSAYTYKGRYRWQGLEEKVAWKDL